MSFLSKKGEIFCLPFKSSRGRKRTLLPGLSQRLFLLSITSCSLLDSQGRRFFCHVFSHLDWFKSLQFSTFSPTNMSLCKESQIAKPALQVICVRLREDCMIRLNCFGYAAFPEENYSFVWFPLYMEHHPMTRAKT